MNENTRLLGKRTLSMLLLADAAFLVYYVILSVHSRPNFDDITFASMLNDGTVWNYMKEMYAVESGRFMAYFGNAVYNRLFLIIGNSGWFPLYYYILGVLLCWIAIKDIRCTLSRTGLFAGMLLMYNLYIYTNIDFPVFTWLCATMYLLAAPKMMVLIKYLNLEKLRWNQCLLFGFLVLSIGGGNEVSCGVMMCVMFFNLLYYIRLDHRIDSGRAQTKRILWTMAVMLVLLAVVVAAPGNWVRMERSEFSAVERPSGIIGLLAAMADVFVKFFYFEAFALPYYLTAFFGGMILGAHSEMNIAANGRKKTVLLIIAAFVVYLGITSLPNAYLFGGFGYQRNYTHCVFVFILAIAAIGFVAGCGRKPTSGLFRLISLCAVALTVIICTHIVIDTPTCRRFSKAVDSRTEMLVHLQNAGQTEPVEVEPIPDYSTYDLKYLLFRLAGRSRNPQPELFYFSDADIDQYVDAMRRRYRLDYTFRLKE
mgnify:CR=1 FL=1